MFGIKKKDKSIAKKLKGKSLKEQCKIISDLGVKARKIEIRNYQDVAIITKQEFEKYGINVIEAKQVDERAYLFTCQKKGIHIFNKEKKKEDTIRVLLINEGEISMPDIEDLVYKEKEDNSIGILIIGAVAIAGAVILLNKYGDRLDFIKNFKFPNTHEQEITIEPNEKVAEKTKDVTKPNVEEPQSESDELSMCLIDPKSGSILYEKACDNKMNMASTTKIMTAIIGLENCDDLTKEITVTEDGIKDINFAEYANMGLQVGEKISLDKIFEGIAVHSACDGCDVLARVIEEYIKSTTGKDVKFVDLMNKKAEELGMKDTHFTNTYGASVEGHHTSTKDMCKLMSYCVNQSSAKEEFRKYFGKTTNFVKPATNKNPNQITYPSYTNNNIMKEEGYTFWGKTGFTDQAGQCWVFCAEDSHGNQIIGAVFSAANTVTIANDVQELTRYGFKCIKVLKELSIINSPTLKNVYAFDEQVNTVYVTPKQGKKEDEERG